MAGCCLARPAFTADGYSQDRLIEFVLTICRLGVRRVGDYNVEVSLIVISPFIAILASNTFLPQADCNLDGAVNFFDIAPFIAILAN